MKLVQYSLLLIALLILPSFGKIVIATSLTDFGSIASAIGGARVEAFAIAKPTANPHSVEVLPSYMVKVARSQLYIKVGLGLDGWAESIISGSRNTHLTVVDASSGIEVLEKPTGKVDASMGDVHPEGNPHYWLDPNNGIVIAQNIYKALVSIDPKNTEYYAQNLSAFNSNAKFKIASYSEKMKPFSNQAIFTYHSSWPYFAKAFGLRIVGKLEPVPGIPPTAKHLQSLLAIAKSVKVIALLQEPYFPLEGARFLERNARIPTKMLPPNCTGVKPDDYWNHFEFMIQSITVN